MEITGALHIHSRYSYDGKESLSALRELFMARGLRFVCMSEHTDQLTSEAAADFVAQCRALSDAEFVFVPGFEMPYQEAHVLLYGCTEFGGQVAKDATALRAAASLASLVVLAHPVRNHFILDEALTAVINGIEIWNQQYDGKWRPRCRCATLLTSLRRTRPELLATAGLDFHRREHAGAPTVLLEVEALTEAAIMAALKNGQYHFGSKRLLIGAKDEWWPTLNDRVASVASISIIVAGKRTNQGLAALGLKLPTSLKQLIRRYV